MSLPEPRPQDLAEKVVAWQKTSGRHHLPWQNTQDPYRVWLSEIMLQQTQVATVLGYYERFLERFPTVKALATAEQDEVMPYWAGLGYYARARNLHRCAREVMEKWDGRFPDNAMDLATLPGIGRSTACAIAAFCFGERSPIMDGNVKRVFTRYFGIYGPTQKKAVENTLWAKADEVVELAPASLDMAAYTQGLMDLGSQCCTRSKPTCSLCPLQSDCYAHTHQAQSELPSPKERIRQDERYAHVLILELNGQVLLEQRPDKGIWGGLLTLPQFDDAISLQTAALHWSDEEAIALASFQHVFSHFKLHITPWLLQVDESLLAEPVAGQQWQDHDALEQTALPAPIRKLLLGLYQSKESEQLLLS
ncbi:A/G-specific adenine glycosylase [Alcaligenes faecalis]|uniref:A/G-specific adenine glycosylase n=1 Tax=Alcaligenes faecalis TaxID=511 RepID=UPI00137C22C5|nr:A/G-specific adenine glycosylase [Alcaligenes faecalis]QHS37624.1 A/G-specific adenine glycosylase [Alcaligenes faecalis]